MQRSHLRVWLGSSVLGSALVLGCGHTHHETCSCSTASAEIVTSAPTTAIVQAPEPTPTPAPAPAPQPTSPYLALARTEPVAPEAPAVAETPAVATAQEVSAAPQPVAHTVAKEDVREELAVGVTTVRAGHISQHALPDITARPEFRHSEDYGELVGQLVQVRRPDGVVWVVRFASVDDSDVLGGSVTLHEPGAMAGFSDGQLVRVQGRLLDPNSTAMRPYYRAHSIEAFRAER